MAEEAPSGGNPVYDLSDIEDGEAEDRQPMMLGSSANSEMQKTEEPPETAETEKINRGGKVMNYLKRITPGKPKEKGSSEEGVTAAADGDESAVPAENEDGKDGKPGKSSRFKKDWSKEQEALSKLKTSAMGTLSNVGKGAAEGGTYLLNASKRTAQATADGFRKIKLVATPLEALCKAETSARPCPRMILLCCTAIASAGLEEENIFKEEAPQELVEALTDHMQSGHCGVIPPHAASPQVLAAVMKQFLYNLPEPLLTTRLIGDWVDAGNKPLLGRMVMTQLPSVNFNAFDIILDTCNRIAENSAINGMDASALAQSLVPSLIWRQQKANSPIITKLMDSVAHQKGTHQPEEVEDETIQSQNPADADNGTTKADSLNGSSTKPSKMIKVPLEQDESVQVIKVIGHLISGYRRS